jgi:hypothetical protein
VNGRLKLLIGIGLAFLVAAPVVAGIQGVMLAPALRSCQVDKAPDFGGLLVPLVLLPLAAVIVGVVVAVIGRRRIGIILAAAGAPVAIVVSLITLVVVTMPYPDCFK